MINVKSSIIFVCLIALSGCASTKTENKAEMLKVKPISTLVDRDKFIEQNKERSKEDVKYGPKINTVDVIEEVEIRDLYNVQVDVEEPFDYVDLHDDGSGKVFPVDVNVENMDIRTFANMLSKITGVNVLVSEEVGGFVTAKMKDVPWPSALDSVLKLKSLAKFIDVDANIIRIHDQTTITQLENFERQRRADLQATLELSRASEPMYTEMFKLFYTKPNDVRDIIQGVFASNTAVSDEVGGRSTQPQITVDGRTNSLIIKARRDDLKVVRKLINQVDTRTKQIFIEAFVVEVDDDFERRLGARLGMDFDQVYSNNGGTFTSRVTGVAGTASSNVLAGDNTASLVELPVAGATSGISFLAGLGSAADLKIELSALQDEGVTKVVSNPRIFTLDNQEAVIFQGTEVPYETVSDSGTQIEFKEAGLKLAVTPTVVGDGNLLMSIKVNKDTVDTSVSNPPITKSEITTNLVTADGSIVVIGGIYTETEIESVDKVPLLGDIPVAKRLFRHDQKSDAKKELMIFIAPRVI